jgi:glutamyl-tRNA synthetase
MIENGEFEGWEDIRLPFVGALRRRGYQPEAFQKYATEIGISMTDKSVELNEFFKTINSFNKEVIDPLAHRYFFIREPIEVTIKNALHKHICLDLHPDAKKGGRVFETTDTFYLAKEDVDGFYADELYRLMDCLNFMKKGKEYIFMSEDYETYKKNGKKIIHWLPKNKKLIDVEILMPDNTTAKGYGEEAIAELEIGAIVQFERFGFCRLDSIEGNVYTFWFGHT